MAQSPAFTPPCLLSLSQGPARVNLDMPVQAELILAGNCRAIEQFGLEGPFKGHLVHSASENFHLV